MKTPPPMPLIRPVRDSSFGFGFLPRIGPLKTWIQGPLFELCEPHDFTVCNTGFAQQYYIPAGYQFDKASVPPLAWSFGYTPDGLCTVPALEHDFLCDLHAGGSAWLRERLGEIPPAPPPAVIHKHFHLALQAWGTRGSKAKVMFTGVDWFGPGGKAWPSSWFKRAAKNPQHVQP